MRRPLLVVITGLSVCLFTTAIFLPSLGGDFVWEDHLNLLENTGWRTEPGWWFESLTGGDYKPLVWAGYSLEYMFWEMNPLGYHLDNILLHALNALMVFFLIRALCPCTVRVALFSALVFSLHPLRVESVAWITERKDVQFSFFYLLALLTYLRYLRKQSGIWYLLAWLISLGAFFSKAMAVSLPFILLLVDTIQGRIRKGKWRKILLEKLPFLVPAAIMGFLALQAQVSSLALTGLDELSLGNRFVLCSLSGVFYLYKTIIPLALQPVYRVDIAALYFLPLGFLSCWAIVFLVVSLLRGGCRWRRTWTGWSWYLLTWLPISGIARTGLSALADRFSYLPAVGLSLVLAWLLVGVSSRRLALVGAVVVIVLSVLTIRQQSRWRNNAALWEPMLGGNHPVPIYNLANESQRRGFYSRASRLYLRCLELAPRYYSAHYNLANLLAGRGDISGSEEHYRHALKINPGAIEAHINLGNLLFRDNRLPEAQEEFRAALELDTERFDARNNLANTLAASGQFAEAIRQYDIIKKSGHANADTWFNLGYTLERAGDPAQSAECYRRALELSPGMEKARRNLALVETEGRDN